jgi:hypothetical protein
VRAANSGAVERRLGDIERLIRGVPADASQPASEPITADPETPAEPGFTLADAVRQAASNHANALLILPQAIEAAQDSPYDDVDRIATILDAMALVARRRQSGALGVSLRDSFRELGVEYRGGISKATPARLREQYRAEVKSGEEVSCEEHIAIGGGTYDPRHCLRIYFTSRARSEPRFVILHVGRHFEVESTT